MFLLSHSREVETVASLTKDNLDLFSERRDPNALKVHHSYMIKFRFSCFFINIGTRQGAIPF